MIEIYIQCHERLKWGQHFWIMPTLLPEFKVYDHGMTLLPMQYPYIQNCFVAYNFYLLSDFHGLILAGKYFILSILYPATQKVAVYYVIPSEKICVSVRQRASFPDSNLRSFWPIFFKLCIDIGEEWFGISNGLNSFINNWVMALDWCKMCFSSIWYWQNVGKDNYKLFFVIFQRSYDPWLMSEFYFHLISWEQIDGFWWNFVYAVVWLAHGIFLNFSTEFWPLIDVKISFFRTNEWILITFCLCIDIYDPCCD